MTTYQILNGDSLVILPELSSKGIKADLIFADPPYNIGVDYGAYFNDRKPERQFFSWCEQWIGECYVNLKSHGSLWLLINHENAANIELLIKKTGFTILNWITWYESFGVNCATRFTRSSRRLFHAVVDPDRYIFNREAVTRPSARQEVYGDKRANPEGRLWDDVWGINPAIPRVCGTHMEREDGFPTQLPLKLLKPIISCASHPGDLVIDPFSGSATTGAACLELERRYIGIDTNSHYVERSRVRLFKISGESYV